MTLAPNSKLDQRRLPLVCDPTCACVTPNLDRLLNLWSEKKAGNELPARTDFGLRDLAFVSEHIAFIDVVRESSAPRFRMRLMGSTLERHIGHMTGRFIDEVLSPEIAAKWAMMFSRTADGRVPLRWLGRVEFDGRNYLICELLCLPLATDRTTPDALLASAHYHSQIQSDYAPEHFASLSVEVDPERQRRDG